MGLHCSQLLLLLDWLNCTNAILITVASKSLVIGINLDEDYFTRISTALHDHLSFTHCTDLHLSCCYCWKLEIR